MKNITLFILATILYFSNSFAQCPPGDVIFFSQQEVNDFGTTYPNCTTIQGYLNIGLDGHQTNISDLSPLSQLTTIEGDLLFYYNVPLTNITALSNIDSIGGRLRFHNNFSLLSLEGLENVTTIHGDLTIDNCDRLSNLIGLDGITTVGGALRVRYNNELDSLTGLNQISHVEGKVLIESNAIKTMTGLESLTTVNGDFNLTRLPLLSSLTGLENLTYVGGMYGFFITEANRITDLTGLENLTTIEASLSIYNNAVLIDLTGLDNLAPTITNLYLSDNPFLSVCHVDKVCAYLEIGGEAVIENNAPGCNTRMEVEDACFVPITPPDTFAQLDIFPNPNTGIFNIKGMAQGTYTIHNTIGQIIETGNMENDLSIDISTMPNGVYLMSILIDNQSITKRITKM